MDSSKYKLQECAFLPRITFSSLQRHLQLAVVNKMLFKDFVRFSQISKAFAKLSSTLKGKLPLFVNYVFIDIKSVGIYFNRKSSSVSFSKELLYVLLIAENAVVTVPRTPDEYQQLALQLKHSKMEATNFKFDFAKANFPCCLKLIDDVVTSLTVETLLIKAKDIDLQENSSLAAFKKLKAIKLLPDSVDPTTIKIPHLIDILFGNDKMCNKNSRLRGVTFSNGPQVIEMVNDHKLLKGFTYEMIYKSKEPDINYGGRAYIISKGDLRILFFMSWLGFRLHTLISKDEQDLFKEAWEYLFPDGYK